MPVAYWNLLCSIRDVGLFNKGISINRHWRLWHVKQYFGIKGSTPKVLAQLKAIKEECDKLIYDER